MKSTFSLAAAICCMWMAGCSKPTNPIYACDVDEDCPGALVCDEAAEICVERDIIVDGVCGDGIKQVGEACDYASDANLCPYGVSEADCNTCSETCELVPAMPERCGDGKVNGPEDCDVGSDVNLECPYGVKSCKVCNDSCRTISGLTSYCGDGDFDTANEECDEGRAPATECEDRSMSCLLCTTACKEVIKDPDTECGNGVLEAGEDCDEGKDPDQLCAYNDHGCSVCSTSCNFQEGISQGFCGDGVVQSDHSEECDTASMEALSCAQSAELAYGSPSCVTGCTIDVSSCYGAKSVASGLYHTCAVRTDGELFCWGANGSGQIGNDSNLVSTLPVNISFAEAVEQVVAGVGHTCALTESGTVYCWGANNDGQVGINGGAGSYRKPQVVSLANIVELAAGDAHTCARDGLGAIHCWGSNLLGQLGEPFSTTSVSFPVTTQLASASALAAFGASTCVIANGSVSCAGMMSAETAVEGFQPVANTTGAQQLAVGGRHACLVDAAGGVKCWGSDQKGQLGNSTASTDYQSLPSEGVQDTFGLALDDVTRISAGGAHVCARSEPAGEAAKMYCWGEAPYGFGDTSALDASVRAVHIEGLDDRDFVQFDLGKTHGCGVSRIGQLECWGEGGDGQLGVGSNSDHEEPQGVSL